MVLLRYTGIALGILVFAMVLMVCGEGACGVCADSCCVRALPGSQDVTTLVGRVRAVCRAFVTDTSTAVTSVVWRPLAVLSDLSPQPLLAVEVAPLRI